MYQDVANDSIQIASDELRNMANDESGQKNEVVDVVVSCDMATTGVLIFKQNCNSDCK